MEDYIMTVIKRASIFMILAQAFMHFRPSSSYEKYFKFLIGIMTTVILIVPIMELLQKGTIQKYEQQMSFYIDEMKQASGQELPPVTTPDRAYFTSIEEEIKAKLNNSIVMEGYELKIIEFQDVNAETMKMKIRFVPEGLKGEGIQIEKIQRIELEETAAETEQEKVLRAEIAKVLEMQEEYVEVEIVE